ncbi:hypothetical protein HOP50_07g49410 [Chloropicon primus]|uniref:Uncharacterized protein n=1 Tax=Chloropicon primus TaxID=1764295 RepID=A0A5B8MSQ4_9CHLO|nr:hypothetical protein A3770_07p49200 [Chloropicon primus]UPR01619.1 hypothetical protein HOP50_07g49410 [Chloropicon primus]|eukprot:QDZ22402.1 hypothetical protein A3770_07p49200 [Chloropicon primus]
MANTKPPSSRKGGTFVGNLKRGNAWERVEGAHPKSSIPSSYVTILLPYREKDGFNSRTTRFNKRNNDLPGPGYYHNPTTLVNNAGSMSCKGYCSGFLSKDTRFGTKLGHPSRYIPGPGEYNQRSGIHMKDDKYFNRSATTAAFSKSVENLVPHKKQATKFTPGPGAYDYLNGLSPQSSLATKSSISAFKSSTKRFGSKSSEGASVGQYTLPDSFTVKERKYTTFKSSTGRYSSPEKGQQGKVVGSTKMNKDPEKAVLKVAVNEVNQRSGPGPGPGTYEIGVEDIDMSGKMKFGKYSSIFGKTATDRFGRPVQPKVGRSISPGPGQYAHSDHMVHAKGANSAFISSTDRSASSGIYQLGVAPGPCKYNPGRVDKKTFHLNTKKRWM